MRRIKPIYILLALCATLIPNQSAAQRNRTSLEEIYLSTGKNSDTLNTVIYDVLKESNFQLSLEYARELYDLGKNYQDDRKVTYAAAVMGMCHVNLRQIDSAYHYLREAINVGEAIGDDWGLASAYNGMGLYMLNFGSVDYYQAIEFFQRGLEAAKRGKNARTYSALLANIAWVYYVRKDTTGLPYALEAYEHAVRENDPHLIFMGTHICSAMYYLDEDYGEALRFILQAEKAIMPELPGEEMTPFKAVLVYTLYGDILLKLGHDRRALAYYDMALNYKGRFVADELAPTYISYGDYYKSKGRIDEALTMYFEGLNMLKEADCYVSWDWFYKKISECYEALGDYDQALRYHKEYLDFQTDVFNVEKERSLNEMRVRYDLDKMEVEIENNKLVMLQQKRKAQILWLFIIIAILVLAGTLFFYRRREKFYLEIVRQSQAAVRARQRLQHERTKEEIGLTVNHTDTDETKKYAFSPLSSEKGAEWFARLEQLMENEKLYRNNNLNIDMLAQELGINRSYLSRIINENSGLNFNNYINRYRINEAMETLSDTQNDIPLKVLAVELGFKTLATFYNSFQKEAGLPPSKYRKKVMELNN